MKKKMTILTALVLSVFITGYSVSGTYAKYVSKIDRTDDARVAKWEIGLTNTNQTIDLFKDSYDFDGHEVVRSLGTDDVVAPGTDGKYTFQLTGNIETNYKIKINVENDSDNNVVLKDDTGAVIYSPIKFYLDTDAGLTTAAIDAKSAANASDGWFDFTTLVNKLNALYSGDTTTVYGPGQVTAPAQTIYWKWDFDGAETDHDKDTTLGENSASHKVKLHFTIKAEQTQDAVNVTP